VITRCASNTVCYVDGILDDEHAKVAMTSFIFGLSLVLFNDPAPAEIYTLSLHDALPISLLGGTRDILLAQLIDFNMSKVLNWGFAAALSSLLLATTLVIYAVSGRVFRLHALWGTFR